MPPLVAEQHLHGGWCCREDGEFELNFVGNKDDSVILDVVTLGTVPWSQSSFSDMYRDKYSDKYRLRETDCQGHMGPYTRGAG